MSAAVPPLVLLVDDFEDGRDMYSSYLQFRGLSVVCAAGGREAVEIAARRTPDLVLMDLRMPELTGVDVLKIFRADAAFDRVPILALTASAFEDERRAAVDAGFDGVIAKPCLPDELFGIVVDTLAAWRPELGPLK